MFGGSDPVDNHARTPNMPGEEPVDWCNQVQHGCSLGFKDSSFRAGCFSSERERRKRRRGECHAKRTKALVTPDYVRHM